MVTLSFAPEDYTLSLSGFSTSRDTQTPVAAGQNGNLQTVGVYLVAGHQFSPDLKGNLSASYPQ